MGRAFGPRHLERWTHQASTHEEYANPGAGSGDPAYRIVVLAARHHAASCSTPLQNPTTSRRCMWPMVAGNPAVVREKNPGIMDQTPTIMTRQQVLDLYFLDARFKLIELAAFLDRVERAEGDADLRLHALRQA